MKAEFYYNKRKYTCSIAKTESLQELRIRNEEGEVIAIEQGKKIGFQGKSRENSKQVDVSQPYYYNLIKAALSALEIAEKNQLILEKERIINVKNEKINILEQQLNIVAASRIDQIRKLRNIADHPGTMYLWQFDMSWSLLIGSKNQQGVLQEIYSSSNTFQNNFNPLKREMVAITSPPSYSNTGSF